MSYEKYNIYLLFANKNSKLVIHIFFLNYNYCKYVSDFNYSYKIKNSSTSHFPVKTDFTIY